MGKEYRLKYTTAQLDNILNRADVKPFVIWHDDSAGVYRFFPDEAKRDAWVEAYTNQEMTPEIAAYEFVEPVTAPAPFTININLVEANKYILEGTTGVTLDFTFETRDGNEGLVLEPVDVYYTFRSPSGTKNAAAVYNAGTDVHFNIDNYINIGTNTITILVRGRSTGASKTIVASYSVVVLNLTSNFQIAHAIDSGSPFEVTYTIEGSGDKTIEFYIDGTLKYNPVVSSLEPIATKVQRISGLLPGKHTLQMIAKMQMGDTTFKSRLLYFEFIVKGLDLTTTIIAESFPNTQDVFNNVLPGLSAEQYVIKSIDWAYYSSRYDMLNATITWRLYTEGGIETPIATRNADVVEAETDIPPEPLQFMPTESGTYHLQALINNNIISDYTISVVQNSAGIIEATDGLTMKLSGLGRDNSEPSETLDSWENRGFTTEFFNQPWNNVSGWNSNALWLNGGATARINNKPFASEISPTGRNGCAFEIDFETFNVNNEDGEVLRIGELGSASLVITSNRATLRSASGRTIEARFKSDERIKVAFVVYPSTSTDYARKVFLYCNGVMSGVLDYELADNFNIGSLEQTGSTVGMINLGNADSDAGIKIYYIRTYSNIINMYEELNNYFIDSGNNISDLILDNDIYSPGTKVIDVDKLMGTITTVKFTGNLGSIIGTEGTKDTKVPCALEISSPENPNINMHCAAAQVNKAGQSTLDKPVPSFHVRLDKIAGNQCYDRDDKPLPKNRWAFREGNTPEKKFRLQANYMDSSCCHNGSFLRMYNEVAPRVQIIEKSGSSSTTIKPLRIPSEVYASEQYPSRMQALYGDDPSGNNWKFPYRINIVPDSIPCIVVWRPDESSNYQFLGQYLIMEEKKANYANGMHSIRSGVDAEGKADPYGFKSTKSGVILWDNKDCHQMEILSSVEDLPLFLNDQYYEEERDDYFELVYPDDDDLTPQEVEDEWAKFYNDVVHPIVSSKNNQAAFEELLYGDNPKLDRWSFAAYYCLAMRNACSDSFVRNMELVTYDGNIWGPKWWDVDMQCGLEQSGYLTVQPTSTRDTEISPGVYAFSGRVGEKGSANYKSSWLWDGLENSTQFMEDVKTMDAALYEAGWRYQQITKVQDNDYVDSWSDSLYNESSIVKYLTYDELNHKSLQGSRTPHRHWFLRTSFDYFDALHCCGEYMSNRFEARTVISGIDKLDPSTYKHIRIIAALTSYFGWEHTNTIVQAGIKIERGEIGVLDITENLHYQDPLHILGANKIEALDISELSQNLYADINLEKLYDSVLGSLLKKLILGTGDTTSAKVRLNNGEFNTNIGANTIGGILTLSKLEYLDVQGMHSLTGLSLHSSDNKNYVPLKELYAAGTNLDSFNPTSGSALVKVELPTTIRSIEANQCKFTDSNNNCVISWYKTLYNPVSSNSLNTAYINNTGEIVEYQGSNSVKTDRIQVTPGQKIKMTYTLHNVESNPADIKYAYYPNLPVSGDTAANVYQIEKIHGGNRTYKSEYTFTVGSSYSGYLAISYAYNSSEDSYLSDVSYQDLNVPVGVEQSTVPSNMRAMILTGMGTDHGAQELITQWLNAVYTDYGDAGLQNLQLVYRNINWEGVSRDTLNQLAKVGTRTITGRIKVSGELSGEDIVNLQEQFGRDIFTNNPGVPLRIDADAGFILGAPEEILAGNTAQVTGVAFPIEGSTTVVTYRLGTYDGQGNFVAQTRLTNLEGRHYYQYKDTVLYEDDGTIVTRETLEPDYNIVVEGATISTADYATITVKRRTYPEYVNYNIAATPGKRVSYDAANNSYYVTDSDLRLILTAYTVPEQVTGTIATETWTISNEIAPLCRIDSQTGNLLEIYVEDAGETMSTGTITYTKTYVDGTVKSKTMTFRFKTPVAAVTTRHNAPLQASLYNAGYAERADITMDYEIWKVQDLSFALISGNTLLHLGEFNDFLNLNMTNLNLSNCTNLGNNSNLVDLEDGTQDYINVFPRASQTLAFDFENINLSNTRLAGINLKQGSTLESITYGDYTEEVVLVNQSALTEVNIPEDVTSTMDKLVIENCDKLEEITWI